MKWLNCQVNLEFVCGRADWLDNLNQLRLDE